MGEYEDDNTDIWMPCGRKMACKRKKRKLPGSYIMNVVWVGDSLRAQPHCLMPGKQFDEVIGQDCI